MKFKLIVDKEQEEQILAVVHAPSELTVQIENLIRKYSGNDKITGYTDDGIKQLSFADIECITVVERKIVAIDLEGKKYRINRRLWELEKEIPAYFIRINKSTLANEHRIVRFDAAFSGGVDAVFACGYREYVSRRCFAEIRRRLGI